MHKYKKSWKQLRKKVEAELKLYKSGDMMSMAESIHGEHMCEYFLAYMDDIEYVNHISKNKPDKLDKKSKEK